MRMSDIEQEHNRVDPMRLKGMPIEQRYFLVDSSLMKERNYKI